MTHFGRTLLKLVSFPPFLSCITRTSHLFFQRDKFQGCTPKSRWPQRTEQQHTVDKSPATMMLLQHKLLTTGKYFQLLLVSLWDSIRSYSKLTEWPTLNKGRLSASSEQSEGSRCWILTCNLTPGIVLLSSQASSSSVSFSLWGPKRAVQKSLLEKKQQA